MVNNPPPLSLIPIMKLRRHSFPWLRQRDSMECGATCLAMVARHYGKAYSPSFLSGRCEGTSQGVSLHSLSLGARSIGFDTRCVILPVHELKNAPLPCIVHWKQNHYVVLYKVTHNGVRFHLADPAKGKVKVWYDEFAKGAGSADGGHKGVAMLLEPNGEFGQVEDTSSASETVKFLMGYVRKYARYFIQVIIGLGLGCLFQLIFPFLTQAIVDRGIHGADLGFIWLVLLGEVLIVAGSTATGFIRRWLLIHITMRVNITLVSDFFVKLLRLPMGFFEKKRLGDLLQRIADHSRVQNFLTGQALNFVFTVMSLTVFGVVLLVYSPVIFGVFTAGSVAYAWWMVSFMARRKVIDYELFEQQGRNQDVTYQFVTAMQEIKLQGCQNRRRWEWENVQADLFDVNMKTIRLQQSQEAGCVFINEIKNVLITILSAAAVIDGSITLGAMLAIQYIVGQLNSPVDQLMTFAYGLQDVKISLERINEVHNHPDEDEGTSGRRELSRPEMGIMLENVSFKYDRSSPVKALDSLNIDIPKGKVTAIVGASGSGKTTLVKLLLGYFTPTEGLIFAGGDHLGSIDPEWWRRRCGTVMQEGFIFSESIARNIACDDAEPDMERVVQAARTACIHDYVESLPLRYDTVVGKDGKGLSKGQMQRLLIARAVYRDPDYILLDEATNSLDASNERSIVENLAGFYRGRTVVIVAHRLSTVCDADNIIVLDGGRVVEQGTHAFLTSLKGEYYRLVRNQLELGL